MINVKVELDGLEETITRPSLVIVSLDIKNLLGMDRDIFTTFDDKDTLVKHINKLGEMAGNNTIKDEMINMEITEASEDGREVSRQPLRPDWQPIYQDNDNGLGAQAITMHHSRTVTARFKYLTKSKSKAYGLINKLRMTTPSDGMYMRHELEYSYILPNFFTRLLVHINHLKNLREDEANRKTFIQYLSDKFDDRLDIANTLDADIDKCSLVIRETQLEVLGYISDDVYNIATTYEEDIGFYSVEFEYKFTYEKPVSFVITYPYLVYNNFINKEFRNFIKPNRATNRAYRTFRGDAMAELSDRDNVFKIRDNSYYLSLPDYDDVVLPKPITYFARMFSVLSIVDTKDPTLLFHLDEIPKVEFKDSMKKFLLESEREYVSNEFKSLFYIELFQNDRVSSNKVILSQDGTLRTTEPMDIKKTYRVVFNVLVDLNILDSKGVSRFKTFVQNEIDSIDNIRHEDPSFQDTINYWDNYKFDKYTQELRQDNMVTVFLNLFRIPVKELTYVIGNTNEFYNIPFKLTQNSLANMITKSTVLSLPAILQPRIKE